jgi:uncharacterized protein
MATQPNTPQPCPHQPNTSAASTATGSVDVSTELTPGRSLRTVAVLAGLILLPFLLNEIWNRQTRLPARARIAIGTVGGRYREVALAIGHELQERSGVQVEFIETHGSLENLQKLLKHEVDFALFQPHALPTVNAETRSICCVANMYSEAVQILVRRDLGISDALSLRGRSISLGPQVSGDHATALLVLEHLGLTRADFVVSESDYPEILAGFREKSLDSAIVTVGQDAEFLADIAREQLADVVSIPYSEAFATRLPALWAFELPAGLYSTSPSIMPSTRISTVAVRAQLLTRDDVSNELVEEVTRIAIDQQFERRLRLRELFTDGESFARESTEFRLHEGAIHVYDPGLKPLLPADFVEATEGLRSFVVSLLVAAWLATRWFREHRNRQQEHRLDVYIQKLLEIERRQMDLDQTIGSNDCDALQALLDEVTTLRQEALREVDARELNDEPAAGTFIQMCQALSEKINSKLTRQRIELGLRAQRGPSPEK